MPRRSATVHRTEKLIDLGNSLAVGLQQYFSPVHPVTCSLLWVRCLFDQLLISDFGGKWPLKWKVFPDWSTGHWISFRSQIWWKSTVLKLPKGCVDYYTKKLGLCGTRPSPHFAQNGPIAPKVPWTLSTLDMSTYTEFGPYRLCFAADVFRKDWFFGPKSNY